MSKAEPLRIGILGAAGITPEAMIEPARDNADVRLVAVAARNRARAEEFAEEHGIERVLDTYEELVNDPEVDAIYIPLPNSHHARWTIAAIEAGKHVLVEKPFASNLAEARTVAQAANRSDVVVKEGFHYRHHALMAELEQLIADDVLGEVTSADARFDVTLPDRSDIRYNHALAGGATMDLGCYPVHLLRQLFGEPEVLSAQARTTDDPQVDEALTARLEFPGGISSTISSSLNEPVEAQHALITGARGTIEVNGFVKPQHGNELRITIDGETTAYEVPRQPSSYAAQLAAFVRAVRGGGKVLNSPEDSLATMAVIDAMYVAAGLDPRPTASGD